MAIIFNIILLDKVQTRSYTLIGRSLCILLIYTVGILSVCLSISLSLFSLFRCFATTRQVSVTFYTLTLFSYVPLANLRIYLEKLL